MASWGSPRGRAYREASPSSPLTPLSPNSLPQWLRSTRSRHGWLTNGRAKVILMGTLFFALGFMITSMFGPGDDMSMDMDGQTYDASAAGVLTDPLGFGTNGERKKRPGIIGSDEEDAEEDLAVASDKQPTVSGALADLHHAVNEKIQSWNPYFVKETHHKEGSSNSTASKTGTKNETASRMGGESVKDGLGEEERLGARTRIGKVTILFSGNSFWERCIRTHEDHDRVHGYRLHVLRQQLMDDVWSKPAYILSLLLRELAKPESERLDWLFWVDADTVILNPYIPIETFLPPPGTEFDDVYLMYSNDWNGLNNGVFPIRVNQWAVSLFSAIVSYRHFKPEEGLTFRDQSAMNALMQEPEFARHIVQAPQRWFNAYQGEHNETLQPFQVRRGDLLVHFAGVPDREARMQYWLERAEQHLDEWEVPVKSTSYPQEAKDFWEEQREIRKTSNRRVEEARKKAEKVLHTTDSNINDYGDRLSDEQREKIGGQRDKLQKVIDEEFSRDDVEKIKEGMKKLEESSEPLAAVITEANKSLLKSAHEAIFAGEKDLLDNGFGQGASDPEMEEISTQVQNLKALVMAPQEKWNRNEIKKTIDGVTDLRTKYQEKIAAEAAAAEKKMLDEAQAGQKEEGKKGSNDKDPANKADAEDDGAASKDQEAAGDEANPDDKVGSDAGDARYDYVPPDPKAEVTSTDADVATPKSEKEA